MSVNLLTHNNQDKNYVRVAAAGAGIGYLAKNILPVSTKEYKSPQTKQLLSEAKRSSVLNMAKEYNAIKKEIEKGTLTLDPVTKDIFAKNRKQIISGKIADVTSTMQISKEAENNIDVISKRILNAGNKTWDTFMENAEAVAKNTRSAICFMFFGALAAISLLTLGNSAKTISNTLDKNELDVNV